MAMNKAHAPRKSLVFVEDIRRSSGDRNHVVKKYCYLIMN